MSVVATVENPPAANPGAHVLGAKGNFGNPLLLEAGLDPRLIGIARDYGAVISRGSEGEFKLNFTGGDGAFDYKGDLKGLKAYLGALRQPLHAAIQNHEDRVLAHQFLRYMLTGGVTLPEFIHPSLKDDMNACHAGMELKIRTEAMWKATGEIDIKGRVDSYNPLKETEPLEPAILPGTRFDVRKGFVFNLRTAENLAAGGTVQRQMEERFWAMVHEVTGQRYEGERPQRLYLTPAEMAAFSKKIHAGIKNQGLGELIGIVEAQERVNDAIARIDASLDPIEQSAAFRNLVRNNMPERSLEDLARVSSALKPILDSQALKERWAHYFFSERHDAPMKNIVKELNTLNAVIAHYQAQGNVTDVHAEAIAIDPQFFGLLAFGRETCRILGEALALPKSSDPFSAMKDIFSDASVGGVALAEDRMKEEYRRVLDVMKRATGQGDGAALYFTKSFAANLWDFMKDLYTYPLKGPKQFMGAALCGAFIYWCMRGGDVPKIPEVPKDIVLGSGADTAVVHGDVQLPGLEDLVGPMPELSGSVRAIAEDPRGGIEWVDYDVHWTPWGFYRHYFKEAVVGTSQTFLDMFHGLLKEGMSVVGFPVRERSAFIDSAIPAVSTMGLYSLIFNALQNSAGHAVMYGSFSDIGHRNGPGGIRWLFNSFNKSRDAAFALIKDKPLALPLALAGFVIDRIPKGPTGDLKTGLACTLILGALGYALSSFWPKKSWPRKYQKPEEFVQALSQNAKDLIQSAVDGKVPQPVAGHSGKEILNTLDKAARGCKEIEKNLPADVREAVVNLKYRSAPGKSMMQSCLKALDNAARFTPFKKIGLSGEFTISAKNLRPVLHALAQMDAVLALMTEQLGIENKIYQSFIKGKLDDVTRAMMDYQHHRIDKESLRHVLDLNLRDLIGAQMYLHEESPLYEKLYGHAPDAKSAGLLQHFGAAQYGRKVRQERMEKAYDQMAEAKMRIKMKDALGGGTSFGRQAFEQVKFTAKAIGISQIWAGAAAGVRAVQSAFCSVPHKKKAALIAGSAALAVVAADIGGYNGPGHEAIQAVSSVIGAGAGVVTTTGTFLFVNTVDDQVTVHFFLGGAFLMVGATAYFIEKRALQPAWRYAWEKWRNDPSAPSSVVLPAPQPAPEAV